MEQVTDPSLLDDLLGPLHMHFRAASLAYADYLAEGKSFLFASSLRRINSGVRDLLLSRGWLLPEDLQADAAALLRHYDVWLTLWDDLAGRLRPAMADPFVFANAITFPKASQERLESLYGRLRAGRDKDAPTA